MLLGQGRVGFLVAAAGLEHHDGQYLFDETGLLGLETGTGGAKVQQLGGTEE